MVNRVITSNMQDDTFRLNFLQKTEHLTKPWNPMARKEDARAPSKVTEQNSREEVNKVGAKYNQLSQKKRTIDQGNQ